MYCLNNDYSEAACPQVLAALSAANTEGNPGYSTDPHCAHAAALIAEKIGRPDAAVHFVSGGTQANLIAIAAFLKPYEAAIGVETAHIHAHENGCVEAAGHKVLLAHGENGKLTPDALRAVCAAWSAEYHPTPRLVYLSNTTELGTVYTGAELDALRAVCDELGLLLFLDGARLGSALSTGLLTWADLGRTCDAFYIGGTKNGALFGEALVLLRPELNIGFRKMLKQRGGMLAKGFVLGLQFEALMTDDLYLENARHANRLALQIRDAVAAAGFPFTIESPSNQQFFVLPDPLYTKLRQNFVLEEMGKPDAAHTEVRACTSWATTQQAVDAFVAALNG